MKKIVYLLSFILFVGCQHTIPFKEAEPQIDKETKIFLESRAKGDYKRAIEAMRKVIELNQQSGEELYQTDMYFYLAELYREDKNYKEAIKYYQKSAKEYFIESNRQKEYLASMAWIARLFMKQGNYQKSLEAHQKTLKFLKTHNIKDKQLQLSNIYGNMAILYQEIGEYQKALSFNQKSLNILIREYPNQKSLISTNYNNISAIKNATGEYAEAIEYLLKSLKINRELYGENNPILISSYNNIAIHYIEVGDYKKALSYLKKALTIAKEHNIESEDIANIYEVMANIYRLLKDGDKPLHYYQKSLALYKKLQKGDSLDIASLYKGIGKYYEERREFDIALEYYQKALEIEKKILKNENNLIIAQTYEAIGIIYLAKREYNKSLLIFKKVLNIRKKSLKESNPLIVQVYQDIATILYNQKRYKESYRYFKKSFDFTMQNMDKFFMVLNSKDKKSYIKTTKKYIQLLLESAISLKDGDIASITFDDWLNYKGTLFDRENAILRLYNIGDKNLKSKIDTLLLKKRELAKLYQQNINNKEINQIEQDISSIELSLEDKISKELKRVSQKEIEQYLRRDELYMDYAKLGERYFLFTIDKMGTLTFQAYSIKDSKEINRLVFALRDAIRKGTDSKPISSKLYEILMKYVDLDKRSLIISTDGILRLLPFETLYNNKDRKYLIQSVDIRYTPSGKEFIRLHTKKREQPTDKVVIFDNPNFNADIKASHRGVLNREFFRMKFGDLPYTKYEAEAIKSTLKGENIVEYQSKMANESNLLNLKSPKILHIATHGFFIHSNLPNPMLNSGIALSGANKSIKEKRDEGIVTALKLSGLNLRGTNLVVLSACQTGVIDTDDTDSISGLNKAFIQAGASGVIVSLWSVSDEGTKEFMELFYKNISKSKSYSKALKDTKIEMIERGKSVLVWGAFVFSGGEN